MQLQTVRIRKILYATDLSETAVHAFSYAVSLANLCGAGITILHVFSDSLYEPNITAMIGAEMWEKIKERHYDEARDKLIGKSRDLFAIRDALKKFSDDAKVAAKEEAFATDDILIKNGAPADVIVETAKEQNCDLIVMGTHGHGTITSALIGSTARQVVRESKIPVLVVRLS